MTPVLLLCLYLTAFAVTTASPLQQQVDPVDRLNEILDQLFDVDNVDQEDDNKPKPEVKFPVLLVPGLSASQIEARLNKTESVRPFCAKQSDWFTLWLNPALLIPGAIDCWIDNFKLIFNEQTGRTENTPGVETRVPGFGDVRTIEYLSSIHLPQTGYFHNIISGLLRLGYKKNETIRGAPYDFRKAPNEQAEYLANVKLLIEEMYTKNGNKKVIIITHSMGGTFVYYLLLQQDQAWKDKHVRSVITLSAPWGGASGTLQTLAAGEDDDSSLISKESSRLLHRSHPSFVYLLPKPQAFRETVIMQNAGKNYTAADIPQILELIGDTVGSKLHGPIDKLFTDYKHPGVEIHCLRGTGTTTVETIKYNKEEDFPFSPEKLRGPGDGTINQQSLDLCLKWKDEKGFHTETFDKVKHVDMVKDAKVVKYVTEAIQKS